MGKHVAAALNGVGTRLDEQPALLFRLRKVDAKNLIAKAGPGLPLAKRGPAEGRVLAAGADGLSGLFGLELGTTEVAAAATGSKADAKSGGDGHVARL
ncbi:MAG: hypothetical protein AB1486_22875 [Planctomycetota bacterium]